MKFKDEATMRGRSGSVDSSDPLVCFLYLLMRDHLVSGAVEEIMLQVEADDEETRYTNGWLAEHAKDIAFRLKGDKG